MTTLRQRIEQSLAGGVAYTDHAGDARHARLVERGSDRPPMLTVRYAGRSPRDEAIRRPSAEIWCSVREDADDPEPLADAVWDHLRTREFIPVGIEVQLGAPPPGSSVACDNAIIVVDGVT